MIHMQQYCIYRTQEYLAGEKLVNLVNHELFVNFFLANSFYLYYSMDSNNVTISDIHVTDSM